MNWKEKRQTLKKMQNGEWEKDGDEALEDARNYVDQEGAIVGQEREDDISSASGQNSSRKGSQVEETIEMAESTSHGPAYKA